MLRTDIFFIVKVDANRKQARRSSGQRVSLSVLLNEQICPWTFLALAQFSTVLICVENYR